MATKITNYEEAKQYLTKAEIDSYETMKTFATPQLLKTFEKELVKSANKRQKEENALREKSIKLIQLFQELFNIESVMDVEDKMRELAKDTIVSEEEINVNEITENNEEDFEQEEIKEDNEEKIEEVVNIDDFEDLDTDYHKDNNHSQFHW